MERGGGAAYLLPGEVCDVLGGPDGECASAEGGGRVRLARVVDYRSRQVDPSGHRQHLAVQDVEAVDAHLHTAEPERLNSRYDHRKR